MPVPTSRSLPRAVAAAALPALLATALLAAGCHAAAADGDSRPIRVLRVEPADPAGLLRDAEVSVAACQVAKQLPRAAAAMPPAATLAALNVREEEELFDGARYARYVTERVLAADPANGCQPAVFAAREAIVELGCDQRIRAGTAPIGLLVDPAGPPAPPPEVVEEPGRRARCERPPRKAPDLTGVAVQRAGAAECVWTSELLARQGVPAEAAGFDTCVYAKLPDYRHRGLLRPVVLQTRVRGPAAQAPAIASGHLAQAGQMRLAAFSDGSPLPADRFTRAAADAFVRQPVRSPVGGR